MFVLEDGLAMNESSLNQTTKCNLEGGNSCLQLGGSTLPLAQLSSSPPHPSSSAVHLPPYRQDPV